MESAMNSGLGMIGKFAQTFRTGLTINMNHPQTICIPGPSSLGALRGSVEGCQITICIHVLGLCLAPLGRCWYIHGSYLEDPCFK